MENCGPQCSRAARDKANVAHQPTQSRVFRRIRRGSEFDDQNVSSASLPPLETPPHVSFDQARRMGPLTSPLRIECCVRWITAAEVDS